MRFDDAKFTGEGNLMEVIEKSRCCPERTGERQGQVREQAGADPGGAQLMRPVENPGIEAAPEGDLAANQPGNRRVIEGASGDRGELQPVAYRVLATVVIVAK